MDAPVRNLVRQRAGECCESCRLSEGAVDVPFHVEHIVAKQHGGDDSESNLALACDRCNLSKGPNLSGIDSETDEIVPLCNPRTQSWTDHFAKQGVTIVGITPTGRATVQVLNMNAKRRLQLRSELRSRDESSR